MTAPVGSTSVSFMYTYNEAEVRKRLAEKSLEPSRIDAIISEIKEGDFSSLKRLGLDDMVKKSPHPRPKGDVDAAVLRQILENTDWFNLVELLSVLHEAAQEMRKAGREARRSGQADADGRGPEDSRRRFHQHGGRLCHGLGKRRRRYYQLCFVRNAVEKHQGAGFGDEGGPT